MVYARFRVSPSRARRGSTVKQREVESLKFTVLHDFGSTLDGKIRTVLIYISSLNGPYICAQSGANSNHRYEMSPRVGDSSNELKWRARQARPETTGLSETERTESLGTLESETCRRRKDDRGYEAIESIASKKKSPHHAQYTLRVSK